MARRHKPLPLSTSCAIPDPLRDPSPVIEPGEDAREALRLSVEDAEGRGHAAVLAPHVLLALLEDPHIGALCAGQGADLARLDGELLALLDEIPASLELAALDLRWLRYVTDAASAAARGRRSRSFSNTDLLGAAVRYADPVTGERLARAGLDKLALLRRLAHGEAPAALPVPELPPDARCALVMHNDDYTTQDFVVGLLIGVYGYRANGAEDRMLAVHYEQRAVIWRGLYRDALTRLARTEERCRDAGMPLIVTLEPEEQA